MMMKITLFVVLALLSVLTKGDFSTYTNCAWMDKEHDFKLYWTLEQNQIKMAVSVKKLSSIDPWAAIGFSKTESEAMISDGKCSDAVIVSHVTGGCSNAPTNANCSSGCSICYDDLSICSKPPTGSAGKYILDNYRDTINNYQVTNVQTSSDDVFSFEFSRLYNTGDDKDVIIDPNVSQVIIYALGEKPANEYLKHRADTRGQISLVLSAKSFCNVSDEIKNPYTFTSPSGAYTASWAVNSDSTEITVQVTAKTSGWAGFGIGKDSTMPETDVVIAYFDTNNNFVIYDGYATDRVKPVQDVNNGGKSDIKDYSGSRNGDTLTFKFTKTLNSNDVNDVNLVKGETTYLFYALGPVDSTGILRHTDKGAALTNFFGGDSYENVATSVLRKVHGSLMFIGWAICLGSGILIANKMKRKVEIWFYSHVGFQVAGSLIVLVGIIVIFQEFNSSFVPSNHAFIGLAVFTGMLLQIVFGIITNRIPATRKVVHFLHRWLGRLIFPLAFVAIILGIQKIGGYIGLYVIAGIWFLVFIINICIPYKGEPGSENIEMGGDHSDAKMATTIPTRTRISLIVYTTLSTALAIAFIVIIAISDGGAGSGASSGGSSAPISNKYLDIKFQNYSIPKQETSYKCISIALTGNTNRDAIRLTPIVDNKKVVHHMILFDTKVFLSNSQKVWDCAQMPNGTPVWVWAAGGGDFVMPENVGQRYGPNEIQNVVLQIHYDMSWTHDYANTNEFDSSGVRITFSDTLQQYQMGVVRLGVPINKVIIPAGKSDVTLTGTCPGSITKALQNPLKVFSTALHMHFIGKKIWVDQIRNGASIGKIAEVTKWDFNNQQFLRSNATIQAGDTLDTSCVWDSTSRTTVTTGGEDSVKEMCFAFLFFYPRINGDPQACGA